MKIVNYKTLKSTIIKACKQAKPESISFGVSYEKLINTTKDLGLVPVCNGMKSARVTPEQIPFISEYFEKSHLCWFNTNRHMTVLTFVDASAVDAKCQELLDNLERDQEEDPNDDKVYDYATIVANYPCYFATIVSYQSNNPKWAGKPSYEIVCRANKVVIKSADYQYNAKDFS